MIDAWINLGILHLAAARLNDAEELFKAALKRDPASVVSMACIGLARWLQGETDAALGEFQTALEAHPENYYVNYLLGQFEYQRGDYAKSMEYMETSLRRQFPYVPSHYPAGLAYLQEADRLEGLAMNEPDDEARHTLQVRAAQARVRAETLFMSAKDFASDRPDPLLALGCVRAALGRPEEAQDFFLEARKRREQDPILYYGLAYITYKFGVGVEQPEEDRARVEAALDFVRDGAELGGAYKGDKVSEETVARCKVMVDKLTEWLMTKMILDERFSRADNKFLGNNWIEHDRDNGIQVEVKNGRALFSGKQMGKDLGLTLLERQVPKDDIYVVEAIFTIENMKDAECGLSIFFARAGRATWRGVHVARNMKGDIVFGTKSQKDLDGKTTTGWMKTKIKLPDAVEIRIRYKRVDKDERSFYTAEVWDPLLQEWREVRRNISAASGNNPTWKVAIWGRGYKGREYTFLVDDVRVYTRKAR
ncbi:MAG: tetratricopeptide repeat protein [Planctomycetota bacterium]|jgi:tetratricopeptide (TPR) repeat protein